MAFEVADSAEFIASQSERVSISQAGVQDAAAQLLSAPLHSGFGARDALEPLGLDDGAVLEWPAYYRNVTCDQLSTIFASTTHVTIPLLNERADVLHEASRVLEERFAGSVKQLVAAASGSVQKLIGLLAQNFSSYCDVAEYKGRQVHFLKRAQIFAADVWSRFGGKGVGEFDDIDSITMFADYRVPQCLCYLGVLEYSSELRGRLRAGQHLPVGSEEEVEIRGCSIAAVERIRRQMSACTPKAKHITSAQIDFYLWNFAKTHSNEMEGYPIHRTLTVFY
ncbi:hypothetical protein EMCRGX_G000974 [Ephydatia muelleri]